MKWNNHEIVATVCHAAESFLAKPLIGRRGRNRRTRKVSVGRENGRPEPPGLPSRDRETIR